MQGGVQCRTQYVSCVVVESFDTRDEAARARDF